MAHSTSDQFVTVVATAAFNVLSIGHSQARKASFSVRHVPHANQNIVKLGGRQHAERHFTLEVPTEGELDNLDACLGLQGTLTYHKGSFVAALVDYDVREWFTDGQTVDALFVTDAD